MYQVHLGAAIFLAADCDAMHCYGGVLRKSASGRHLGWASQPGLLALSLAY